MRIVLDVGGGLAKDTDESALSNIPLRWMMCEILKARCHVYFDETALELWNIPSTTVSQVPITRVLSDSTLRGDESDIALGKAGEEANAAMGESASIVLHPSAPSPDPHVGIHDTLDAVDAVQKMGNAFKKNPIWWILELVPTYHEWQNEEGEWVGKYG
jgi:hypothetical protein